MRDDQAANAAAAEPEASSRPLQARRPNVGMTIGGILAGVDGQIFRSTPPAAELVQGARPVRGLSGEDGTLLSIELPEDEDSEAPG
jgi:hypothetical protein